MAALLLAFATGATSDLPVFTASSSAIKVANGSYFLIALASNPSTGYTWSTEGFSKPDVAQVIGSGYLPPTSKLLGAPGTSVWVIKATATGTTTLTLAYARSFESAGATAQTFQITVTP
jgi:inhibitor of cysteine peptidase